MRKMLTGLVTVLALGLGFASAACPECIDPRIHPIVSPTPPPQPTSFAPATAPVQASEQGTLVFAAEKTPSTPVAVAVAATPDGDTGGWVSTLLPTLLGLVGTAGTAALVAGFSFLRSRTKLIKIQAVQTVLDALFPLLFGKVKAIFDESTTLLKAAAADGKLTPEEARAALLTAVNDAWKGLPAVFVSTLLGAFGSEGAAKAAIADKVSDVLGAVKSQSSILTPVSLGSYNGNVQATASTPIPTKVEVAAARARIGLR